MTPKKKDEKTVKISKKTTPKTSKSPKKAKSLKKSEATKKTETKLKVSKSKPKSPKNTPNAKSSSVPKKAKTKSKVIKKSKISKLSLRKKTAHGSVKLTSKILKKRVARIPKKQNKSTRGVVYLKNIPHGFYEYEMKQFFSQFGQVTGVRIPKSTRTGKYKGYAFVEFLYPDVAKIAAETMNGYLMYKRLIKAKYLPQEEQKNYAFKFPTFKVPLTVRRKRYLRQRSNRVLTEKESEKEKKRVDTCVQKKMNKLKKLNIDYQFQVANSST